MLNFGGVYRPYSHIYRGFSRLLDESPPPRDSSSEANGRLAMMAIIGMCRGFGVGAFSAIQFLEQEYNQL